jgi:hypothetical protein
VVPVGLAQIYGIKRDEELNQTRREALTAMQTSGPGWAAICMTVLRRYLPVNDTGRPRRPKGLGRVDGLLHADL